MGKYIVKSKLIKEIQKKKRKSTFEVKFRFGGNVHTERFEAFTSDIKAAVDAGFIRFNENGYADYLDWKPLGGAKNIEGGIYPVLDWKKDKKYLYAISLEKTFSLPLYLEHKVNKEDLHIFFGKRVG